jgi:hypothetical protein
MRCSSGSVDDWVEAFGGRTLGVAYAVDFARAGAIVV